VRRLPDSPERIARGVWAGVFTTFTPFYAMHFVVAALIARLINGNILAALSGTFFGNPLTYVPIGIAALQTGHWMLGTEFDEELDTSLVGKFIDAGKDLKDNLFALFRDQPADWDGLHLFYDEVFFPYLVGGIVPGVITATICYMVSLPVIRAYQQHRRSRIKAKFDAIKKRAEMEAAGITPVVEAKTLKAKLTLPRVRKAK
jgi:uncharacterized protein (DUF2062 family)